MYKAHKSFMKTTSNADVSSCCFNDSSVLIKCLLLIVSPNVDTIWTTSGPEISRVINEESSVQFRSWVCPTNIFDNFVIMLMNLVDAYSAKLAPCFWKWNISFQRFSIKIRHSIILWSRLFRHCNGVVCKDRWICIINDF